MPPNPKETGTQGAVPPGKSPPGKPAKVVAKKIGGFSRWAKR
jgi:hypothetical protein